MLKNILQLTKGITQEVHRRSGRHIGQVDCLGEPEASYRYLILILFFDHVLDNFKLYFFHKQYKIAMFKKFSSTFPN